MSKKKPIFVIQAHDASHLHFDFRLEVDGVLKSWAIPKGPSTDSKNKRLAVFTTDHAIEYANFEGVIPEGEYGAGTVMVWDKGTYKNIKEKDGKIVSMDKCIKKGEIDIWLDGKKIKGGYALIKTKLGKGDNWLLIKKNDDEVNCCPDPIKDKIKSILTNRTLKQIANNP